jgi:hypothetical protein
VPTQPPAQCIPGLSRGKERPGRDADPSSLPVPWSWMGRAIPLLPLWAVRPVQSLSASTRVHFTFTYHYARCPWLSKRCPNNVAEFLNMIQIHNPNVSFIAKVNFNYAIYVLFLLYSLLPAIVPLTLHSPRHWHCGKIKHKRKNGERIRIISFVQVHFRTSVTTVAIKRRGLSGAQRWTRLTLPLMWIEPLLRYCSLSNMLQEKLFFGCLTQEDGTDRLSQNVGTELPFYADLKITNIQRLPTYISFICYWSNWLYSWYFTTEEGGGGNAECQHL